MRNQTFSTRHLNWRRTVLAVTAATVSAGLIGALWVPDEAQARRRKGGQMRIVDIDVGSFAGVPLNTVIQFKFSQKPSRSSVHHATFRIREENATQTGFTKQVPGAFQIQGRSVNFFPRLSTHLRDPDSATNEFFPEGSTRDDADENAGLHPEANYEITVVGHPNTLPVRSNRGRKLRRSETVQFTTAPATPRQFAYTLDTYQDAPPPGFVLSNPPDKVATPLDQYAKHGGTVEVQNDLDITLFGNRVPLNPTSARQGSNITLTLTERQGDQSQRKPIPGTPHIEQNFDTAKIVFSPRFALPDLGAYAFRVTKDVKDIQGTFDYRNNPERLRLRGIWEFLDTARTLSPTTPPEQLENPPIDLIFDWPVNAAERGILKTNALILGDTYPDEIDPRVMVLFSTRDEPVSDAEVVFEFVESDGNNDVARSTGSYDELVSGSAAAIMTVAGGSGADGGYEPVADEVINVDQFTNNTINWRNVLIPPGVVVTLEGSRPAILRALNIEVNGEIRADGRVGQNAPTGNGRSTNPVRKFGGAGGPGGGKGGDMATTFPGTAANAHTFTDNVRGTGYTGTVGNDSLGNLAVDDGGRGGRGGTAGIGTIYNEGAGGGGGGSRLAGTKGANNRYTTVNWNGIGGQGGNGSSNDDLLPLVGGAGGGAGATASYAPRGWNQGSGAGGGGGGAVRVDSATLITIGSQGVIRSRGGTGGKGTTSSTNSGGPGGGGGGGAVKLRSSKGFNIADPGSAIDVRGGPGGTNQNVQTWVALFGGTGGEGYVRLEDPNGGILLPGATQGVFDPVGGGVPSFVYTLFVDIGVGGPRILNFTEDDFTISAINDAILIEAQFAIEDSNAFGQPDLSALLPDGSSVDDNKVSQWTPVRYVDNTGQATPAIPGIPGYDPGTQGNDAIFDITTVVTGRAYKFLRLRITFQLDDDQSSLDPLPFVDRVALNFQFNF